MASCVRNVCAKNRENPSIPLKVTIDNVGVPLFETQCTNSVGLKMILNMVLNIPSLNIPESPFLFKRQ